jgi:hypothetical protein
VIARNAIPRRWPTRAARRPAALPAAAALPANPVEGFMSGYISGFSAVMNFALWAFTPLGALGLTIGFLVALVGFLSVFAALSRNPIFQGVLGWSNWIRPYSYLATAFGILLFLVNFPFALAAFGLAAVRLDLLTGTIETTGGLVGLTGFAGGGFNLGNYTFLSPGPIGLAFQSPFGLPGVSAYETGHTLTVASFGGVFHWIDAIDENIIHSKATSFLAYAADGSCRRIGRNLGDRVLPVPPGLPGQCSRLDSPPVGRAHAVGSGEGWRRDDAAAQEQAPDSGDPLQAQRQKATRRPSFMF